MAEERGLTVDTKGFADAMEEARERSRSAQNKVFLLILACRFGVTSLNF